MTKTQDLTILVVIAAALAGVFTLDLMVPLGTAVWLIYILPLSLAVFARWPALPVATAVLVCVAMALAFQKDNTGIDPTVAAVNRGLAGIVYLCLGFLGRRLIVTRGKLLDTDWITGTQVAVSRAVQGDLTAEKLARQVLQVLADRIGARAAVAYARNGHGHLRLAQWGTTATPWRNVWRMTKAIWAAPSPKVASCRCPWRRTRRWAGRRDWRGGARRMR